MMLEKTVTKSNGWSALIYELHHIHRQTFREIASQPPFTGIPVGTVYSIYRGNRVPNKWRKQLGLPKLVKVPETMVRKTTPSATPDIRHRRAINLDDAQSALKTIDKPDVSDDYIFALVEALRNAWCDRMTIDERK